MYLLDTNVVSELRKAGDGRIDARVAAWIAAEDAAGFFISALTLMELEIGILRVERRDTGQGRRLRRWMDRHVLPGFGERTLPVNAAVALTCARLRVPGPRAERDALIAATAIVHGMAVVTGNTADFEATGVRLVNPWAERRWGTTAGPNERTVTPDFDPGSVLRHRTTRCACSSPSAMPPREAGRANRDAAWTRDPARPPRKRKQPAGGGPAGCAAGQRGEETVASRGFPAGGRPAPAPG